MSTQVLKNSKPDDLALLGGDKSVPDPIPEYNTIGEEEKQAAIRVFNSGKPLSGFHGSARPTFFGGPEVQALESEWNTLFGSKYAVSMNSATSGLYAAMAAVGIGPGDEVIVSPYSMSASAVAPLAYGGIPVFADIEPDYFCMSAETIAPLITKKTRAIIAVNIFGHPADLHGLKKLADKHNLYLIEDNAQAHLAEDNGVKAALMGHIGIYSLNVHKHIHSGEGGVCVTSDENLAKRMQLIRNHGENVTDWMGMEDLSNMVGQNYRLTEISAAIARAQLHKINDRVERVEKICAKLTERIKGLKGLTPPKVRAGCRHNYYMWSVKYDEKAFNGLPRAKFVEALKAEGLPVTEGYVPPTYRLPIFKKRMGLGRDGFPFNLTDRTYEDGLCPVTERMHEKELFQYQPVSWDPSSAQINQMIAAFYKVHAAAMAGGL